MKINTRSTLKDRMYIAERMHKDGSKEYAGVIRHYTWFGLRHTDDYLTISYSGAMNQWTSCIGMGSTWHKERWKVEQALQNLWHLQFGTGPYEGMYQYPKVVAVDKFVPE